MGEIVKSNHFKASITAVKGHWQHKVIGHKIVLKDAFEPYFQSNMTIWYPKLTPKYQKPSVFLHISNRYSRTYVRVANPIILCNSLDDLSATLRSNLWLDTWDRLEKNSEEFIINDLFLDDNYFDMDLFNKKISEQF
jgi:hypothetical protein